MSEQKVDFDKIETCIKETSDDFIKTQENLFNSLREELSEIKKIKGDSHIGEFNIFKSIAEAYKQKNDDRNRFSLEGPNSDILQLILSPKSKEIGNSSILEDFLRYIGIDDNSIKGCFPNLYEAEIEREASIENGRIDLLIRNENHCVIIESKLNNAPNQPFQLQRYYLAETKKKREVVKIVYLTLVPCGELDFDNEFELYKKETKYSKEELREFKNVIPNVKERLVYLPATNKHNEKSLCNFFNTEVEKIDNELIKVILNQYTKLLTELGGIEEMLVPEKELIKKIYESKESVENAETFAEIWQKKDYIISVLFSEYFKKGHKDWREYETSYKVVYCSNTIKCNPEISIYIGYNYGRLEIGFESEKFKDWDEVKRFLKEDFSFKDLVISKGPSDFKEEKKQGIYLIFDISNKPLPLTERFENDVANFDKLFEEVNKDSSLF